MPGRLEMTTSHDQRIAIAGRSRFDPGDLVAERYRVIGPLRPGRLDEAYEAENVNSGTRVGLKVLRRAAGAISPSRALTRRFEKLRALDHPNVARVHDLAVHAEPDPEGGITSVLFATLELVEGDPLGSWVRTSRPLEPTLESELIDGICSGLAALHRKRLVHGDLNSTAIVLVHDGDLVRPVLTDFALQAAEERGGPASIGSPVYRAPETLVGRPPGRESDVFSLGAIIYEILSGRIPFTGGNLLALDFRSLEEKPRPLRDLVDDLDPTIERVVERCLSHAPEDRFSDANEVRQAIRGRDYWTPRTRRSVSTLGAAAALVAVMLGGSALLDRVAEVERYRLPLAAAPDRPSFAILDVAPVGAGTEPWIGAALSELIRDDFSRGGTLRVAEAGLVREYAGLATPLSGAPDEELSTRLRTLFDVETIVIGTCTTDVSLGVPSIALDLCVIDARSGETLAAAFERGSPDGLPDLAARASARLRASLGLSDASPPSIGWDPDAVRPWAAALLLLREQRAMAAVRALEEAASIQPANPNIQDALTLAWSQVGSAPRAVEAARRAVESSRDETMESLLHRLATLALLEGNFRRAIEEKGRLARAFPDRLAHTWDLVDTLLLAGATRPAGDEIRRLRAARATVDPRTEILDARLHFQIGRLDEAATHADRGAAIAEMSGSSVLRGQALVERARAEAALGNGEAALETLREAEAAFEQGLGASGISRVASIRASVLQRKGDLEAAFAVWQELERWCDSTGQQQGRALALGSQANILALEGRHREAGALLEDAILRFRELGDEVNLVRSQGVAAGQLLALGRLDEARERYRTAADIAGRANLHAWEGYAHTGIARVDIESLDLQGAQRHLDAALAIFGAVSLGGSTAGLDFVRSELDRLRGRLGEAESRLTGIATASRDQLDRERQAELHLSLASIALAADRRETAASLAMRAADYYAASGDVDRQAECLTIAYRAVSEQGDDETRRAIADRLDGLSGRIESPLRNLRIRLARASSLPPQRAREERLAIHAQSTQLGLHLLRLETAAALRDGASTDREKELWRAEVADMVDESGATLFLSSQN